MVVAESITGGFTHVMYSLQTKPYTLCNAATNKPCSKESHFSNKVILQINILPNLVLSYPPLTPPMHPHSCCSPTSTVVWHLWLVFDQVLGWQPWWLPIVEFLLLKLSTFIPTPNVERIKRMSKALSQIKGSKAYVYCCQVSSSNWLSLPHIIPSILCCNHCLGWYWCTLLSNTISNQKWVLQEQVEWWKLCCMNSPVIIPWLIQETIYQTKCWNRQRAKFL